MPSDPFPNHKLWEWWSDPVLGKPSVLNLNIKDSGELSVAFQAESSSQEDDIKLLPDVWKA